MKTIFFDVDTQLDFLYPAGALYVPRAETIVAQLGELRFVRFVIEARRLYGLGIGLTDAHLTRIIREDIASAQSLVRSGL